MFDRYLEKQRFFIHNPGLQEKQVQDLLRRIKVELPALEAWLAEIEQENSGEANAIYRFYHQSFKVFDYAQDFAKDGFEIIDRIGRTGEPRHHLHEWYVQIYLEGTSHDFNETMNEHWLESTRPILEAFWHTKYFIQMMVKYAQKLELDSLELLQGMNPGWAAVLYLYELR